MRYDLDYKTIPIRSSLVLTNAYVAGTVIDTSLVDLTTENQLMILVGFTIGSLTSASIKVEFSADNTTFYQETLDDTTTGSPIITERLATRLMGGTGNYRIAIPIKDRYIKISAIGTGTVTSSLMSILAIVGTA